ASEVSRAVKKDVPAERYVMLEVTDTGSGIPDDIQSLIFEPFFTTKGQGKGTGLGLSTVYGIVEQSGGYLALESAVGQTSFKIFLPRVDEEVAVQDNQTARRAVPADTAATVLLVEDEDAVRNLASVILK